MDFSYGFRPGRDCHQALDTLYMAIATRKVNWILDADIKGYFDSIPHEWMIRFLEHRIADKRMLRLARLWLEAGVLEDGVLKETTAGTPQGALCRALHNAPNAQQLKMLSRCAFAAEIRALRHEHSA
jgi:retron-type reverse transcriptase